MRGHFELYPFCMSACLTRRDSPRNWAGRPRRTTWTITAEVIQSYLKILSSERGPGWPRLPCPPLAGAREELEGGPGVVGAGRQELWSAGYERAGAGGWSVSLCLAMLRLGNEHTSLSGLGTNPFRISSRERRRGVSPQ